MSRFGPSVKFEAGQPILARDLNRVANEGIRNIRVGNGLRLTRSRGDATISLMPDDRPIFPTAHVRVSTVATDALPLVYGVKLFDGTNDRSDEFFVRVRSAHIVGDELLVIRPLWGVTTDTGTLVVDANGAAVEWEEVGGGSRPAILAKIVSVISSAGGKYNGTIYGGTMVDDGTGNLALPDGMTAGDDCLVVNEDEDGQPTHWIKPDTYAEGFYGGMSTEDTPRPIIRLLRAQYLADGANTLAIGTSETAYPDTWDRTRVTSGTDYGESVQVPRVTRLVYDPASDQVLYQFIQTDTIAADGRLVSTTAEVRSAVDTPDADCADDPGSSPDYSRSFMSF